MVQLERTRAERSPEKTNIDQRFQQSLWQIPNRGLLFDYQFAGRRGSLDVFLPEYSLWFRDTMQVVRANCLAEQICDHSQPHVQQVAHNGLVFLDMIHDSFGSEGLDPQLFSDPTVVFTLLVHDIGYASQDVSWENRHAIGHEIAGSQMLINFVASSSQPAARSFLELLLPTIIYAIASDTDNRTEIMQAVHSAELNLSQENLFALLIMAADKVDYFRSGRITDIAPPRSYQENPYYYLAWMVENYELIYDRKEKKLHYVVHLFGEDQHSPEDQEDILKLWEREVRVHFPYVLDLLEGIATLSGVELVIEPGRKVLE